MIQAWSIIMMLKVRIWMAQNYPKRQCLNSLSFTDTPSKDESTDSDKNQDDAKNDNDEEKENESENDQQNAKKSE